MHCLISCFPGYGKTITFSAYAHKDMFSILYQYLIQQKSLGLPGLGTLQLQHIPAINNFSDHVIEPPTQKITFDDMYDAPNKNLFQYISTYLGIEEWEAIKKVNDFSFELKNQLKQGNEIVWDKIGVLKSDLSGTITLEAKTIAYDFMRPVAARRIIRSNASHTILRGDREVSESFFQEDPEAALASEGLSFQRRGKKWLMWTLILALLALTVLFIHIYKNGLSFNSLFNTQQTPAKEAAPTYIQAQ